MQLGCARDHAVCWIVLLPDAHGSDTGGAASRESSKACLQRYRQASLQIVKLLQSMLAPGTLLEKASIDGEAVGN